MKIFRIFSSAVERRASRKAVETIEQREARIAKNFSIKTSLNTGEGEAYEQIYPMRAAIANYAKNKGVKINIVETVLNKANILIINVKKLDDSTKSLAKAIPAKINGSYPERIRIINPKTEDGLLNIEDNFLRHIFRNIQDMVKKIQ